MHMKALIEQTHFNNRFQAYSLSDSIHLSNPCLLSFFLLSLLPSMFANMSCKGGMPKNENLGGKMEGRTAEVRTAAAMAVKRARCERGWDTARCSEVHETSV